MRQGGASYLAAARLLSTEHLRDALDHRQSAIERRLTTLENKASSHGYDYRVSLLVVTKPTTDGKQGVVDETLYFDTLAEAQAKQVEIFARSDDLKRKVLIVDQVSLKPVPFYACDAMTILFTTHITVDGITYYFLCKPKTYQGISAETGIDEASNADQKKPRYPVSELLRANVLVRGV